MKHFDAAAPQQTTQTTNRARTKPMWVRVSRHNLCPVCHKPDNCSVSVDGRRAYCRRVESDRPGRDGGFVHILSKCPDYTPRIIALQTEVVTHERAPIAHRNHVHQRVLAVFDLNDRERNNLLQRGMSEEAAHRYNYKSVPPPSMAAAVAERLAKDHNPRGVPGFYRDEGNDGEPGAWRLNVSYWHQGLMVPVRDVEGRIEGFQIRRAEVKDDSPRYVWLSSNTKLNVSLRQRGVTSALKCAKSFTPVIDGRNMPPHYDRP